jgi:hypothetical protein
MPTDRRLSGGEREERRERDRERLKRAAEQLLTSEGWQRWVRVRAQGGLARLSLNNQLLVALSCPEATFRRRLPGVVEARLLRAQGRKSDPDRREARVIASDAVAVNHCVRTSGRWRRRRVRGSWVVSFAVCEGCDRDHRGFASVAPMSHPVRSSIETSSAKHRLAGRRR